MDEKKQIKISLGTIICIFIIAILIIVIGCMYFYYNDTLNENKLPSENQNNSVNSINNSSDLVAYDITKAVYMCEIYIDHFLNQGAYLTFYPNKTFEASISNFNYPGIDICDSYTCSGTYEIKDNIITGLLQEASRVGEEDKHAQNIEFVLEYNKNENAMNLISISSNKIQLSSYSDKNSIEEIQLTVFTENNIFQEYIEEQITSNAEEEQYFSFPAYYSLNDNDDTTIFVSRKLCKYFYE